MNKKDYRELLRSYLEANELSDPVEVPTDISNKLSRSLDKHIEDFIIDRFYDASYNEIVGKIDYIKGLIDGAALITILLGNGTVGSE
jgi:hypothetical protein